MFIVGSNIQKCFKSMSKIVVNKNICRNEETAGTPHPEGFVDDYNHSLRKDRFEGIIDGGISNQGSTCYFGSGLHSILGNELLMSEIREKRRCVYDQGCHPLSLLWEVYENRKKVRPFLDYCVKIKAARRKAWDPCHLIKIFFQRMKECGVVFKSISWKFSVITECDCEKKSTPITCCSLCSLPPGVSIRKMTETLYDLNSCTKKKCRGCNTKKREYQVIKEAPDFPMIYIQRASEGSVEKVDISNEIQILGKTYDLYGMVIHLGSGSSGGHYITRRKSPKDGKWYEFNDSQVSCVKQGLKGLDNRYSQRYERVMIAFYKKRGSIVLKPIKRRVYRKERGKNELKNIHERNKKWIGGSGKRKSFKEEEEEEEVHCSLSNFDEERDLGIQCFASAQEMFLKMIKNCKDLEKDNKKLRMENKKLKKVENTTKMRNNDLQNRLKKLKGDSEYRTYLEGENDRLTEEVKKYRKKEKDRQKEEKEEKERIELKELKERKERKEEEKKFFYESSSDLSEEQEYETDDESDGSEEEEEEEEEEFQDLPIILPIIPPPKINIAKKNKNKNHLKARRNSSVKNRSISASRLDLSKKRKNEPKLAREGVSYSMDLKRKNKLDWKKHCALASKSIVKDVSSRQMGIGYLSNRVNNNNNNNGANKSESAKKNRRNSFGLRNSGTILLSKKKDIYALGRIDRR